MRSSLRGRRLSSFSMICLMAACISRADASSSPSPTPSLKKNLSGSMPHGVEDTDWTFDALLAEGFPVHIVDALRCVTKLSDNEPYDEFIERVKSNPLAIAVKINDLADNMDIRRYKELSDWDVKRLKKYLKAYQELTSQQK